VSDELESQLLNRYEPIFFRDNNNDQLPLSGEEYLSRSEEASNRRLAGLGRGRYLTDWSKPCPRGGVKIYGRVCHPLEYPEGVYVVQYYALFLENGGAGGVPDVSAPVFGLLGGVDIDKRAGYHQGDILCVDFTVRTSATGQSEILGAVFHNHGRQFFIEPSSLVMPEGRPHVFLEYHRNEPWPNEGGQGTSGWPKEGMVSNDYKSDDMFGAREEEFAVEAHNGAGDRFPYSVVNVGEIDSAKANVREKNGNWKGTAVRVDDRSDLSSADNDALKFLLEYPKPIGKDDYCIAEIYFLWWSKCIGHVDSPSGFAYNSSAKMWFRNYNMRAEHPYGVPTPRSRVIGEKLIEAGAQVGNKISWGCVPYAAFYVVTATDTASKKSELFIPDENSITTFKPNTYVTSFRHDRFNGWEPGPSYEYAVEIIAPGGVRKKLGK